jgi:RNA polymerase sigma factor (sigma-70 family)
MAELIARRTVSTRGGSHTRLHRRAQPGTTSLDEAVVFVRERSDPARRTELRTALTAAIDELPAGHRTTLLLREVERRSNGEISRALGLPVPNVKTRMHRARTSYEPVNEEPLPP